MITIGMKRYLIFAALVLSACARPRLEPPSPMPYRPAVDAGIHHTARLGWSAWRGDGAFAICGRRTSDLTTAGKLRGCLQVPAAGAASFPLAGELDAFGSRDATSPEAALGGCQIVLDDVVAAASGPPARATLIGKTTRTLLGEWRPALNIDGDYFALEVSFSPDGKWLALARIAVGLGEDQTVDIAGVEVRGTPPCR